MPEIYDIYRDIQIPAWTGFMLQALHEWMLGDNLRSWGL